MTAIRIAAALFAAGLMAASPAYATGMESQGMGTMEGMKAAGLTPNAKNGKVVYEICAACHMPEGWGSKNGDFPQVAGQHYKVVIKQLADIRARNRDNPTMFPFAVPEEIGGAQALADVAAYISQLPMTDKVGFGPGKDLARGKELYAKNCTECHGAGGEGSDEKIMPRINGQHYNYLLRQLIWIRDGKRRNANAELGRQLKEFNDADLQAVTDYTSRLKSAK